MSARQERLGRAGGLVTLGKGDSDSRPPPGDLLRHAVLIGGQNFAPLIEHNALVFVAPATAFWDDLWVIDLIGVDIVVRAAGRARGEIIICQNETSPARNWQAVTRAEWFELNPRQILGVLNPRTPEFGAFIRDRFLGAEGRG